MCRHLYNHALGERKNTYELTGETVNYYDQKKQLPIMKIDRPWYKGVHSQVLQDVLKRLDNGYKAFFRRVKEGTEAPGFPKFKKRGQWDSITYPQYQKFPSDLVVVSKVGTIKTVYHREIPETAKIKTLTISKEGCKWFACFSVELPLDIEPKQGLQPPIGIDLGLNDFLYDSDGFHVAAPRYLRKSLAKLARLQRRFSAAKKRSPKWYKLLKTIQKCHYKIRCQRNDFLHKLVNSLLEKSDVVVHENLNIKGMSRRPKPVAGDDGTFLPNGASAKGGLNKSINDAGWYQFLLFLNYKAIECPSINEIFSLSYRRTEILTAGISLIFRGLKFPSNNEISENSHLWMDTIEQGKQVIAVPAHYTSQKCSSCGQIVKKSLSVRTHKCSCGFVANRDHNAALNILALGLKSLAAAAA
jgi:putative transposase